MLRVIDSNVGLWIIQDEHNNPVDVAELKISPQRSTPNFFHLKPIDPNMWVLMRELADRDGAVTFVVRIPYRLLIGFRQLLMILGFGDHQSGSL